MGGSFSSASSHALPLHASAAGRGPGHDSIGQMQGQGPAGRDRLHDEVQQARGMASAGSTVEADPAGASHPGRLGRDAQGRPGHQVVLGLFVVLAVCTVIVFTVFAAAVRPEDRTWLPELTARYLYMPVVATGVLVAIDAYRLRHRRWWLFLLAAPIPILNVVLAAAWLLKWRHA